MKLGLGLYRHMLRPENYRFARQAGATHIVAHLVDYWHDSQRIPGTDSTRNWGQAGDRARLWTADELLDLRKSIEAEGLKLAAIENFDPAHWHDVLLDGPRKKEQLENLKTLVRRVGQAGIPAIGYNFSIAGVWGHVVGPYARGGAESVAFLGPDGPREEPIPNGQVWNMTYDAEAPEGVVGPVTSDQLWSRLAEFLHEICAGGRRQWRAAWRHTRTILPCPSSAAPRAWSISRVFTRSCWTFTPAARMESNSARVRSRR